MSPTQMIRSCLSLTWVRMWRLTLKNSLNGVSLWACGLGTESQIYTKEIIKIKIMKSLQVRERKKEKTQNTLPSEYLPWGQVLNFPEVSIHK